MSVLAYGTWNAVGCWFLLRLLWGWRSSQDILALLFRPLRLLWRDSHPNFSHWCKLMAVPSANLNNNFTSRKRTCIFLPHEPHFYILKLEFTVVFTIFYYFCLKYRLWILVRTASPRWFLRLPTIYVLSRNVTNSRVFFYLKIFSLGGEIFYIFE